jgi:hypothetical protein
LSNNFLSKNAQMTFCLMTFGLNVVLYNDILSNNVWSKFPIV